MTLGPSSQVLFELGYFFWHWKEELYKPWGNYDVQKFVLLSKVEIHIFIMSLSKR